MKWITSCGLVLISAIALTLIAGAEEKPAAKEAAKHAGFERIKSLSGEWQVAEGPGEHAAHGGTVTYKVTAGGSAVLETLFGGTDHEMVSLYYVDGEDLVLTHYCMLHNRPTMRAEKRPNLDKIAFACQKGDKIEAEDHMHAATFTFVDADHLKTDWVLYKGGKPDSTHSFELVRKKDAKK